MSVFAEASRWKAYVTGMVAPMLGDSVLEVGAGIGGTTKAMSRVASPRRWVCLEPDGGLLDSIVQSIGSGALPAWCEARMGSLADLDDGERFTSILYMDVLEHIEDDVAELRLAADHLAEGGRLVVLSPAHQWLWTPFDAAVGHRRRYDMRQLRAIAPDYLKPVMLRYVDSVGVCASLANRLLLRSGHPSLRQILLWDRYMVPLSRQVDRALKYRFGKSVLAVWAHEAQVQMASGYTRMDQSMPL